MSNITTLFKREKLRMWSGSDSKLLYLMKGLTSEHEEDGAGQQDSTGDLDHVACCSGVDV